jgi:hypothetical protein
MVQIKIDQAAHIPGLAGVAREDLATGIPVTLTSVGGPYFRYLWRLVSRPYNVDTSTRSSAVLATPTMATSLLTPVDQAGTYLVEVAVDSGSGLGALATDVARITFYAGPTLGTPGVLPRRIPAVGETIEHNVAGNDEGWGWEMRYWYRLIQQAVSVSQSVATARPVTLFQTLDFGTDLSSLSNGVLAFTKPLSPTALPTEAKLAGVLITPYDPFDDGAGGTYVLDVGYSPAHTVLASGINIATGGIPNSISGNGIEHVYSFLIAGQTPTLRITSNHNLNDTISGYIEISLTYFIPTVVVGP